MSIRSRADLGSSLGRSIGAFGSIRRRFGDDPGSVRGRSGVDSGLISRRPGVDPGSIRGGSRVDLRWILGISEVDLASLGSIWGPSGATLGSFWGRPEDVCWFLCASHCRVCCACSIIKCGNARRRRRTSASTAPCPSRWPPVPSSPRGRSRARAAGARAPARNAVLRPRSGASRPSDRPTCRGVAPTAFERERVVERWVGRRRGPARFSRPGSAATTRRASSRRPAT